MAEDKPKQPSQDQLAKEAIRKVVTDCILIAKGTIGSTNIFYAVTKL